MKNLKKRYDDILKAAPIDYVEKFNASEAPDANLKLVHIHGYRSEDTRNNLRYNKAGEIIYHTAAVGVVMNAEGGNIRQRHFFEHTTDIVSLAMHPNMNYVATGEVGPFPLICVWDTTTMECMARISGLLTKAICQLCFSSDGNYLAASASDDYHCIAIYDWDKCTMTAKNVASKAKKNNANALIATGQSTTADIMYLLFNPSGDQLVASCIKELNFISFAGGVIKVQKGDCGEFPGKQALMCAAFVGTTLVTGTFHGQLLLWKGKQCISCSEAHQGSINAIWPRANVSGFITGSNDGTIKFWDQCCLELRKLTLGGQPGVFIRKPKIRSICENANGNILLGTRSGDIFEIENEKIINRMRSHYKGEIWGLAMHPTKAEYATLGSDNMFAVWELEKPRQKCVQYNIKY